MQGLAVVPLFGGFDLDRAHRADLLLRRHGRPVRGARPPRGRVRLGVRPRLAEEALAARASTPTSAVRVAVEALVDAADDDSATGGPDHTRGIWPVVATVTESGLPAGADDELAAVVASRSSSERRAHARAAPRGCAMSMPFYVSPEQLMKDRADYARKGIARGRSVVVLQYDDGIAFATENAVARAAQDLRDLRPDRASRRSASTTSSRTCGWPACATPTCAGTPTTARTSRRAGWPTPTPRRSARCSPPSPSRSRSSSSSPRSGARPAGDQIYRLAYDGSVTDEHGYVVMGGQAERLGGLLAERVAGRADPARGARARGARRSARRPRTAARPRAIPAAQLEVAVLDRTRPRRTFRRLAGALLEDLLDAD